MELGTSFLLLVTGPSGAGKTSLLRGLLEDDPRLVFSVSCTTRPPRNGERDGYDYHFIDESEFLQRRAARAFVETARVHDHLYGTLVSEVEAVAARGRVPLLDIDVQGGLQVIADWGERVCSVFVFPPSWEALESRLRGRATDDESAVSTRLANARREVAQAGHYQYWVVNDDLTRARADLHAIVRAETLRRVRRSAPPLV